MSLLNTYELDITKELISISLANAADSFSKMTQERVLIQDYNLAFSKKEDLIQSIADKNDSHLYILTTNIVGELHGKSYLLINHKDAERICDIFSTKKVSFKCDQLSELQQGMLLELDNIITAAMVTQLSNFLDIFTYGDVPNLKYLSREDALTYFDKDVAEFDLILNVNAKFHSFQSQMSPSFICLFKSEFLVAIKQMIASKKHLSLVKNK